MIDHYHLRCSYGLCRNHRFIEEKQIRAVEAYIKHPPMALCCAGYICGHFVEHRCTEAVMGIGGWHLGFHFLIEICCK